MKLLAAGYGAGVCQEAFEKGLREYSWMKDGVTYVGTCGTTLKQAIERSRNEN